MKDRIGVVLIGRNEGLRLVRALEAACAQARTVVYVDSQSTDTSVEEARSRGVEVVDLDATAEFSAARARNAGRRRLASIAPDLAYIQFIDGDCELVAGWIDVAVACLDQAPDLAAVCGRRHERYPEVSIYNRMIDFEWDTPVGAAQSCGGDAMYRLSAFDQVRGFDPAVTAGEEPELCRRLRRAGWRIDRIDAAMTIHDAAMTRWRQWWNRELRSGYGGYNVYRKTRHDGNLFGPLVRRARLWTIGPAAVLVLSAVLALWQPWFLSVGLIVVLVWVGQVLRVARGFSMRGAATGESLRLGILNMAAKWAHLGGQVRLLCDQAAGRGPRLIEYKSAGLDGDEERDT